MEPSNKGKKLPAEILTGREVTDLLHACSSKSFLGTRNKAILTVLYRSMLRCQEALDLMPKDINLEQRTLSILHGKGNKSRVVGLDAYTTSALKCYLSYRRGFEFDGTQNLFCSYRGKPIKSSFVRGLCKRLATKAGIEKRVHPHGLRHTGAVELLRERVNVVEIQKILGHGSLQTTAAYLDHLQPQEIILTMHDRKFEE